MMMIHGTPLAAAAFLDPAGETRFWHWHGLSGRRYIHSVYKAHECPPLPGAIYIAVKRIGDTRLALGAGRFPNICSSVVAGYEGADELHVHLLASDEEDAAAILADLKGVLGRSCSVERSPKFFERPIANSHFAQMLERRDHVVAAGA
ncbi:hypothetical protein BH10PSE7_BH10PSE7_43020 [soil metagenome]